MGLKCGIIGQHDGGDKVTQGSSIQRDIEQAARTLLEEGAQEVFVFGSASIGLERPDSDIDLAVRGLPPERFYGAIGSVMERISRPFDLIDLDEPSEFTGTSRGKAC